jgi:phosphogluconate dehydratase
MSGASGKVPAVIHVSPEALKGGDIAKLKDGDVIRICARKGELQALVDEAEWNKRKPAETPPAEWGTGRELFALMRRHADPAEMGGSAMLAEAGL